METSLNLQAVNQSQKISEINKPVHFKASAVGSDTVEFTNKKQSSDRTITVAAIGTAIATSIACVRSRMQMSKIEKQFAGNLNKMGENFVSKGKNSFNRIMEMGERFFCLSAKDTLTGLYNRRYLYANLPKIVEQATQNGENRVIAMLDLDHFKSINTAFNHEGGDEFLKEIATILKKVFNEEGELVARYGGEEIVIVTKDAKKLEKLAEEIRTNEKLQNKKDEYIRIFDNLIENETDEANLSQYIKYRNHVKVKDGFTSSIGYMNTLDHPYLKAEECVDLADLPLQSLKGLKDGRGKTKIADNRDIIALYTKKIEELENQDVKKKSTDNKAEIDKLNEKINQLNAST